MSQYIFHFPRNKFYKTSKFSVFIILLWWLTACSGGTKKNNSDNINVIQQSHFVGSASCKECHTSEYEAWKQSDHYKSMQLANEQTVLGNFNNAVFKSKGFTNTMFKSDSSFYMVLENREGKPDTFKVEYTFGYDPLQQYLIEFPKGRLQSTHVAWDNLEKKWFDLYPDLEIDHSEWLHWTGGSQTWNSMCADCHSTNLQQNYSEANDSYRTTWDEINVSCESCHGPGSEHVRLSRMYPDSNKVYGTAYLGANSTQAEQMQFCARCHSRRSQLNNSFNHNEHWTQQYSPDILRPGLYYADGQILDEVYVWGSFAQSKMHRMNVRCTDCHDPHTYQRKLPGNQLCNQCHVVQVYDTPSHHFHQTGTEGAKCESCHMPGRNYMVNDYRPDHSFRVPRPDQSVKYDVPNACNKCHDNQSAKWAADWVVKWYGKERKPHYSDVLLKAANHESSPDEIEHFAQIDTVPDIAKATAIYYLNYYGGPEAGQALLNNLAHPSVLVRRTAVEGLGMYDAENIKTALFPLLFDTARVVRLAVFNALASVDISSATSDVVAQYQQVHNEFIETHKTNADFPSQKLYMGQYYQRTGQTDLAQHYYEETLAKDNYQNMARMNLAIIYNAQQKNQQAAALLKKVIEQEPNYDPAYFSLGLLYAEINRADSAIFYLKECKRVNPQNYGAYYNLGLLYQQQNQTDKAENTFLEGLKSNPNDERLLYAITSFYMNNEKRMQARQYAEKLVKLYPNRQDYMQLLQMTEN